jgi:hypothetical protein
VSQPGFVSSPQQGIVVQKPRWDAYTSLLLVALLAILVAIRFLCLELAEYDWDWSPPRAQPPAAAALDAPAPWAEQSPFGLG